MGSSSHVYRIVSAYRHLASGASSVRPESFCAFVDGGILRKFCGYRLGDRDIASPCIPFYYGGGIVNGTKYCG